MDRQCHLPAVQGDRAMAGSSVETPQTLAKRPLPDTGGVDAEPYHRKPHGQSRFPKTSVAPLEEIFPGTLQGGLDPGQCGQRREILPGFKALPIPGAQPRFLGHLFLRESRSDPHRRNIPSEACPKSAGRWLFRWHARHRLENETAATRGFTSPCWRVYSGLCAVEMLVPSASETR